MVDCGTVILAEHVDFWWWVVVVGVAGENHVPGAREIMDFWSPYVGRVGVPVGWVEDEFLFGIVPVSGGELDVAIKLVGWCDDAAYPATEALLKVSWNYCSTSRV